MVGIGFAGTSLPADARDLIHRGVRNVILFARNIETPQQLSGLTFDTKAAAGAEPLMTCVDQEGGRVLRMREPFTLIPSMRQVGQAGDETLAHDIGKVVGREVRAVNFDMNLAPVCDVDTNPGNPVISSRSFGQTPELVTQLATAIIRGMQEQGVAACAKHFPGHGDTVKDSHHELPTLPTHDMARLIEIELPPFEAAIKAGVAAVMTAHVIYNPIDPVYPGTMSRTILGGILREQLGFNGLVVSDDMQMKAIADHYGFDDAIVRAVDAGVDLLWICHTPDLQSRAIDVIAKAVESGNLSRCRLEEAARRQDAVFARFVKPASKTANMDVIGCREHQAIAERVKQLAGALVEGEDPTEAFARQQQKA
ncbi:MAG: beta-N-acetylhexosaminidase [Phycisphaerales bacterium]|nr:beta-N-acetylhexosaminidase [Phycisphaerales bacterium]